LRTLRGGDTDWDVCHNPAIHEASPVSVHHGKDRRNCGAREQCRHQIAGTQGDNLTGIEVGRDACERDRKIAEIPRGYCPMYERSQVRVVHNSWFSGSNPHGSGQILTEDIFPTNRRPERGQSIRCHYRVISDDGAIERTHGGPYNKIGADVGLRECAELAHLHSTIRGPAG
jgi:hypothetical protein